MAGGGRAASENQLSVTGIWDVRLRFAICGVHDHICNPAEYQRVSMTVGEAPAPAAPRPGSAAPHRL